MSDNVWPYHRWGGGHVNDTSLTLTGHVPDTGRITGGAHEPTAVAQAHAAARRQGLPHQAEERELLPGNQPQARQAIHCRTRTFKQQPPLPLPLAWPYMGALLTVMNRECECRVMHRECKPYMGALLQ